MSNEPGGAGPLEQPVRREENLLAFLDMAGRGGISGQISEWPQLKPACAWAVRRIMELEEGIRQHLTHHENGCTYLSHSADRARTDIEMNNEPCGACPLEQPVRRNHAD